MWGSRQFLLLFLLGIGWTAPASALELVIPPVNYPELPASAADARGFAPAGWQIEAQSRGDFNKDGRSDLVLVLRNRDPANILANEGLGESPFDTNPRILAVALADPGSGAYRLVVQNHDLIPRRESPVQQDPFDLDDAQMIVENGVLKLSMPRFYSAGSWEMGRTSFTFRWQQGALRLIGFDRSTTHRASGETRELSVNYLTHRARIAVGNFESDGPTDVRWIRLPRRPLLTIDQVGDGLAFDPGGGIGAEP